MQIQISWFLQKPTDLDLHCLQRQGVSCSAREGLNSFTAQTKVTDDNQDNIYIQKKINKKMVLPVFLLLNNITKSGLFKIYRKFHLQKRKFSDKKL